MHINKFIKKLFFIFILFMISLYEKSLIHSQKIDNSASKKWIFTFWEPREKMPGYIKLCLRTWHKYLSDYKINILDFKNIKYYLGERLYKQIIYNKLPLQTQADAIRVALLQKYGGIWMDADTIITNGSFISQLNNYELVMLGIDKSNSQNIGFIFASINSTIINIWLNIIINKISSFKHIKNNNISIINHRCIFGNRIIDPILKNTTNKHFFRLDKNIMNAIPEDNFFNFSLTQIQRFRNFYLSKIEPKKILKTIKGIILLHNSFMPKKYKSMSETEFLRQDILLSNLLSEILK